MRRGVSVKTLVVLVLFFVALCAPGFGYTVLWDTSHGVAGATNGVGGYQPDGYYSELVTLLGDDFTVNTTSLGFTDNNLAATDVAVVCITSAFTSSYTAAEAISLANFVDAGGGLLIMGTQPFLNGGNGNNNIQPVANMLGITLAVIGDAFKAVSYTPDALEHPVFAGFTETERIYMPVAGEITTIGANGFALVQDQATGDIFIAGADYGSGRVIALGDFNMFSQMSNTLNRGDYQNAEFALNTFNWLAVPEPATILLLAAGAALLRRRR